MKRYANVINSIDVMNVLEKNITIDQLKEQELQRFFRHCRSVDEKLEAIDYIEKAFTFIEPFLEKLTLQEYAAIAKYGRKIGSLSYEINNGLRNHRVVSYENQYIIDQMDNAISKFSLNEEMVVYRALKPEFLSQNNIKIGQEFTDNGYMSTSLTLENSYAYFKDYEVVLEIELPINTKCIYAEWFKGTNDEYELLLARDTTISINGIRKDIVNGNEKTIYSCKGISKELKNDHHK